MHSTRWTLIERARQGDVAAEQEFVERYRAPLVSYLCGRGAGDDAEDLAQEVFLRLFHKGVLERADPDHGGFRGLLLTVARNALKDHWSAARAKKRGGGQVQSLGERDLAEAEDRALFDREWLANLLAIALERLEREHADYHQALSAFLLEGLSQDEIAQRLDRSKASVRNLVHRGRTKLIAILREEAFKTASTPQAYATELGHLARLIAER